MNYYSNLLISKLTLQTCVIGDMLRKTNGLGLTNGFNRGVGSGWESISTINFRGVWSFLIR